MTDLSLGPLAALARTSTHAVLVEDDQRRVLFANEAFGEAFGVDVVGFVGADCAAAMRESAPLFEEPEAFVARIEALLEAKALVVGDVVRLRDGRVMERDYVPIWVGDAFRGNLWQYRDVTARQRAVEEREREASAARAANAAKTQFLAMMSHDLRTPLNAILGTAQLLAEGGVEAERAPALGARIERNAMALVTLIDDLLEISRIESGVVEVEPAPFDPWSLLEELVEQVRDPAEQKGLALTLEIDEAVPPRLLGDARRLRQVLANLASNAVKYTPRGGVRIRAGRDAEGEGGRGRFPLRVEVRDTGPGIEPAHLPHVFEPFYRAGREGEGTGLGLSIATRIAEAMGASLEAESVPGEGSVFRLRVDLPLASVSTELRRDGLPLARRPLRGRVLVADDHAESRETLAGRLAGMGLEVRTASDGDEAFQQASSRLFELLVLDLAMPGRSGDEVVRALRAGEGDAARTPALCVTAHAIEGVADRCREAGFDEVLFKPVPAEAMARAVRRALRRNVVVVDDDEDMRALLVALLEDDGRRVLEAATGEEALGWVEREPVHLVLADLGMPGMDGWALGRRLASREDPPP
ncbi:MAG TPA: response regulator, partial [Polyangiaceae bacterium LLY-WYZ-15_(1-7)]|nr:response regulator [Polyangiaceae bacterium LLY-WYZ-15_(1-7)]